MKQEKRLVSTVHRWQNVDISIYPSKVYTYPRIPWYYTDGNSIPSYLVAIIVNDDGDRIGMIIQISSYPEIFRDLALRFFEECGISTEKYWDLFPILDEKDIVAFDVDEQEFKNFCRIWEHLRKIFNTSPKDWNERFEAISDLVVEKITWAEFSDICLPYLISESLDKKPTSYLEVWDSGIVRLMINFGTRRKYKFLPII